ncbi:transcription factor IIA subunit alpha [Curvularia kusanoi]|uniref:Transcription factor IIA subunit alpha n=1 Tax=Curvularia kusanoi TaxID=90978 RepID=A0A9P4TAA0_CURKU|nr:transcription factor IIA subunit alpha [Curvularia kusanoi]
MSNQVVGTVYQQIIDKVIQASQNDFEEFGVDQSTLDEMKQGWQEKLSALKVAQFPWDPQPEPVRQPPTVPSNVKVDHDLPQVSAAQDHVNYANPQIKQETPYQQHAPPPPQYPQAHVYANGYDQNAGIAQQRAQSLIMQRQQGNMQQGNMQQSNMMPQANFPNLPQQNLNLPQQGQHMTQQQRMMAPQQQQQMQRPPQQQLPQQRPPPQQSNSNLYTSQTDGAGEGLEDWKAFLAARRAAETEEGRLAADEFMRARVDAMAMQQDSGLMVPLNSLPKGKKRRAAVRVLQAEKASASVSASSPRAPSASLPGAFDGVDDDIKPGEEDPDDAINSDLDDPEDELNDGDNSDDEMVDYMLCTYDKVQRVKNKWKCTLKDGILTTNKKEYLFHKANGEFEW